jgi:hypothetical protein
MCHPARQPPHGSFRLRENPLPNLPSGSDPMISFWARRRRAQQAEVRSDCKPWFRLPGWERSMPAEQDGREWNASQCCLIGCHANSATPLGRDLKPLECRHRCRLEDNRAIFLRRMMRTAPIIAKPGCRVSGDHGEHRYDGELQHDEGSNCQPMQPTAPPRAAMLSRRITCRPTRMHIHFRPAF